MLAVLTNRTYRGLFIAQVVALFGTGFATMALGLQAFDIAGQNAGAVLGIVFTIKMLAYVGISPFAGVISGLISRKRLLVYLDLYRALIVLGLPFVTEVWQIFLLVFLLQSASAVFTPTFQATIPDVLPDEVEYTKALTLSRLAYDLENIASPLLAALLLAVIAYEFLFLGTVAGFIVSALFVISVVVPNVPPRSEETASTDMFRGLRNYLATPRLRGLMGVNLVVAAAGAMILVNTVVMVQGGFGLTEQHTVLAMAAFGAGSIFVTLSLPSLLKRYTDRTIMLTGCGLLFAGVALSSVASSYVQLVLVWCISGFGYAFAQVPAGRLLRRSAHRHDRPFVYAAQFALSHACWLVTYPLAGFLGASFGLPATALVLAAMAGLATLASMMVWPVEDSEAIEHDHADLPPDHPHFTKGEKLSGHRHRHRIIIDELHPNWPAPR